LGTLPTKPSLPSDLIACSDRYGPQLASNTGGHRWQVRIIDPKYYPAGTLDQVLEKLFTAVDIIVTSREVGDASAGNEVSLETQREQVAELAERVGKGRLHFLPNDPVMAQYSSSALRAAIVAGEPERALTMLPECLHSYVKGYGLYGYGCRPE
jgi:hypothetical protein